MTPVTWHMASGSSKSRGSSCAASPGCGSSGWGAAAPAAGGAAPPNFWSARRGGGLRERNLARIRESGARVVAAANPGCLLQIARGCRERGLDVTLVHPVELLARAADAYQG